MKHKRFLSLFLVIVIFMTVLPFSVSAKEAETSEITEPVTFTVLDGTSGVNDAEDYDKLLDGDTHTKWGVNNFNGAYVVIEASRSVVLTGYILTTANDNTTSTGRNPKNWVLYGSNDYDSTNKTGTWTAVHTVTNNTTMQDVNYTPYRFSITDNSTSYRYYKLEITATQNSNFMQLSELELEFAIVTFDKNGGDTEAKPKYITINYGLPEINPARAGYLFDGWYTKNGANGDWGEAFTADSIVSGDIIVYAKWNPIGATGITLSTIDGSYNDNKAPGIATDSSNEIYTCLTDGDLSSKWCRTNFISGDYAIIKASEPFILTDYCIITAQYSYVYPDRIPKSWQLYGCNDYNSETANGTWTLIDKVVNDKTIDADKEMTAYSFVTDGNTTAYQYYKLVINKNGGDTAMEIGELMMNQCSHNWSMNYLAPNCTECGYEEHSCSICGYSYKKEFSSLTGEHTWNSNLICSHCGTEAVAETGDIYYSSLQKAVDAATESKGTVKLVNNVQTDSAITVKNGEIELDLNGFVLSKSGNDSVILIKSGANMTLSDSSTRKTGTIRGYTNETGSTTKGGGVYVAGTFTMNSGTIENCSATNGGGVHVIGTFTMNGGTINNCSATNGGGVHVIGTFTMNGGTINNCSATDGGGVYVNILNSGAGFIMKDGTIAGCSSTNGGGIYAFALVVTSKTETLYIVSLSGGKIINNAATYGGGVYSTNIAGIKLLGAEISENTATYGGGIYQNGTDAELTNGSISKNNATADGGGIYINESAGNYTKKLTLGSVTISVNSAANGGGGIYATAGNTVEAKGTVIKNNNAKYGGGMVHDATSFSADTTVQICDNTVKSTVGATAVPGNLYLCTNKMITMSDSSANTGKIGITFENGNSGFVTTASDSDYASYFTSDVDGYVARLRDSRVKIVKLYTALFNYTDDIGTEETVADGDLLYQPTTTINRNGYNFVGWFSGNSEYDFSTPVTHNLTLTAKWISNSKPDLLLSLNNLYIANAPEDAVIFVAAYSSDRLISIYRGTATNGTTALNALGIDLNGADKLSAFMWNESNLSPLCSAYTVQ